MSHFSVLVIGDDVAAQLQPFHEFECTGFDDEHVKEVSELIDIRKEIKKCRRDGEKHPIRTAIGYTLGDERIVSSFEEVDRSGAHKFGFAVVKGSRVVAAFNRTNPNKKWDWWTVGGRWSEWMIDQSGEFVTSCKFSDVNLEAMKTAPPYAIVKDGKWYARGTMGFWGISRNEVGGWSETFAQILSTVDPNTTVTVVDCHI